MIKLEKLKCYMHVAVSDSVAVSIFFVSLCSRFIFDVPFSMNYVENSLPFCHLLTLQGNRVAEMRPGVCLHASFLSDVRWRSFFVGRICACQWKFKMKTYTIKIKQKIVIFILKFCGWKAVTATAKKKKGHGSNTFIWMNFSKDNVVSRFFSSPIFLFWWFGFDATQRIGC